MCVLVWKSPLFRYENASTTHVDISYYFELNKASISLGVYLVILGAIIGAPIGKIVTEIAKIIWKKWIYPDGEEALKNNKSKRKSEPRETSF